MTVYRRTHFTMPRHVDVDVLRERDRIRRAHLSRSVDEADIGTTAEVAPSTKATAEPREKQAAVVIPDNWRELPWPRLRSLASQVSDDPIVNRPVAVAAIEAEIARRSS